MKSPEVSRNSAHDPESTIRVSENELRSNPENLLLITALAKWGKQVESGSIVRSEDRTGVPIRIRFPRGRTQTLVGGGKDAVQHEPFCTVLHSEMSEPMDALERAVRQVRNPSRNSGIRFRAT